MNDLPLLRRKTLHLVLEQRCQLVHQTPKILHDSCNPPLAQQLVEHQDEPRIAAGKVNDGANLGLLFPEITEELFIPVKLRPPLEQIKYLFLIKPIQRHRAEVIKERLVIPPEGIEYLDRA